MVDIVFDLEVIPNLSKAEIFDKLKEVDDINRIEGNTNATDEFNKEFIFNPINNRIVSISMVMMMEDEEPISEVFFDVDDESKVVNDFYDVFAEIISSGDTVRLIGFNINSFDIPNLRVKVAKYRKSNRVDVLDLKPWETFDIFEKLGRKNSLVKWLDFYELDGKYKGITGDQFLLLYLQDQQQVMKDYSLQDAIIETNLFKKVEYV